MPGHDFRFDYDLARAEYRCLWINRQNDGRVAVAQPAIFTVSESAPGTTTTDQIRPFAHLQPNDLQAMADALGLAGFYPKTGSGAVLAKAKQEVHEITAENLKAFREIAMNLSEVIKEAP